MYMSCFAVGEKNAKNVKTPEVEWNDMDRIPERNGTYIVKFRFENCHETDCEKIAFRDFKDGKWTPSYYGHEGDGGKMVGWRMK